MPPAFTGGVRVSKPSPRETGFKGSRVQGFEGSRVQSEKAKAGLGRGLGRVHGT
jgi:hypothetical protein